MPPSTSWQPLPRYFSQAQLRAFFAVIAHPRDRLLFALIYHHGLRVGEAVALQRADVDLEHARILVRRLKGGVWSEQPLFQGDRELLRAMLRDDRIDGALFRGRQGPLKKRQIQARFTRYRDVAGLPRTLTCHGLRHSIATHLLDAGCALEFVQAHLGHQSIRSTSIYARITDQRRLAVFRELEASPWIVQPQSSSPPGDEP